MKLHELIKTMSFKGGIRIYSYNEEANKSEEYISNSWRDELLYGDPNSDIDTFKYNTLLKECKVNYFYLAYMNDQMAIWICIDEPNNRG